jgi:hypothetical protein
VNPEQPTTRCLELSSGDTGTDADVENVEAGADRNDLRHQCVGITRLNPVVACSVRPE